VHSKMGYGGILQASLFTAILIFHNVSNGMPTLGFDETSASVDIDEIHPHRPHSPPIALIMERSLSVIGKITETHFGMHDLAIIMAHRVEGRRTSLLREQTI